MVFVEDISVSGEYVETLENKTFVVLTAPKYETYKNQETEEEEKRLYMKIQLSDGNELDYYPNKTSIKAMAKLEGFEMDHWIGKVFEFYTNKQNAFGKKLVVLYVLETRK